VKLSEDIRQLDEGAVNSIYTIIFFSLTLPAIFTNIYCQVYEVSPNSITDSVELTLTYLILFTGTRSNDNFTALFILPEFTARIILVVEVHENRVAYSIASAVYDNLPQISIIDSSTFLRMLADKWLSRISIMASVQAKPEIKHYVSVNGKIVEAWAYKTDNGLEYRDPRTGIFLGGILFFTITINVEQNLFGALRTSNYTYFVEAVSYLTSVEPFNTVYEMNVVKVDERLALYPLLAVVFLTVFTSVKTYIKRKEYVIV